MKSKILIGIFMCTLVLSHFAYADGIIIKAQRIQPDNVCKKVCGKSVSCELVSYSDWSNTIQCPGMKDQWVNNSGELINSEPDEQTPATNNEETDLFKLDDKKTEKYTIDEFHEKLKDLEETYHAQVTQHFDEQKCDYSTVEQLGAEYEADCKRLATNTEGMTKEEQEKQLDNVHNTIKEYNDKCFDLNDKRLLEYDFKKDIAKIVEAYNAKKEEFEKAEATQADAAETQEEQQPENKAS